MRSRSPSARARSQVPENCPIRAGRFVSSCLFPQAVRSQIIGYIWDTTAPVGSVFKSQKSGTVTYVVVRSGPADLGKWVTERRDVREDFKRIYGEEPEDPDGISFGIDSDDVKGTAESYMGRIVFRKP